MDNDKKSKQFDLEDRTYLFTENCKSYIKKLPKNQINLEYSKQLIRSSGSVAANYIEANESLSKRFYYESKDKPKRDKRKPAMD